MRESLALPVPLMYTSSPRNEAASAPSHATLYLSLSAA
eukprot:CAMPEP_0173456780 /NCGR_PEP_ID=MMETSP1357-20121228/56566_1 /TAXON_ID=77926 /ORGANISM="Hemiselmis rufescens, Strain PCC563" /LENGTH=37 /DNA_ID= /DNA_START= /DNA_END= /DNA_ORIENTATION=